MAVIFLQTVVPAGPAVLVVPAALVAPVVLAVEAELLPPVAQAAHTAEAAGPEAVMLSVETEDLMAAAVAVIQSVLVERMAGLAGLILSKPKKEAYLQTR